jgi:hypothetical protein
MTTKLTDALKREIDIAGEPWTLTLSPQGFTLVPKGRRKGVEIAWASLVSGEAALAASLNASLLAQAHRKSPSPRT